MGADAEVDLPALQPSENFAALLCARRAREQRAAQREPREQRREILVMLPRENLRRGHERRLPAVLSGEPDARGGDHRLAAADVALTETVHRAARAHVGDGITDGAALRPGERKGQAFIKRLHIERAAGGPRDVPAPRAQQLQPAGEQEQLLEGETAARRLQRLRRGGKVDVLIGEADVAQLVGAAHLVGQDVRQQLAAGVEPLPHGAREQQLADPGRQRVDGHDAPRQLPAPLRLEDGVDHLAAQARPLDAAIEDVRLAAVEAAFAVVLVEKRQLERAAVVDGARLDDGGPGGSAASIARTQAFSPGTSSRMGRMSVRSS